MIRKTFENELQEVKDEILVLGSMVEQSILDSVEALKKRLELENAYLQDELRGGAEHKEIVGSSAGHTDDPSLAIGETVTYELTVTLEEGTWDNVPACQRAQPV